MTKPMSQHITFLSDHRPVLPAGSYALTATQTIPQGIAGVAGKTFGTSHKLLVAGPRYTLDPQLILARFPPEGSLGAFDNALPHITLARSTLPWERNIAASDGEVRPWMALFVLEESEEAPPSSPDPGECAILRMTDVSGLASRPAGEWFPALSGEHTDGKPDTPVRLLSLPRALLARVLPAWSTLPFTAHARADGEAETALAASDASATLVAGRLPANGKKSTVYLVSLEGHFDADGSHHFDAPDVAASARCNFVVLASWGFVCLNEQQDFATLLTSTDLATLALPARPGMAETTIAALASGRSCHVHAMRQGNASLAWYRGPLMPWAPAPNGLASPAAEGGPDARIMLDTVTGLLDMTYAAAWELGRLMMLANKRVSLDLWRWKQACARQDRGQTGILAHLPGPERASEAPPLPDAVALWHRDVSVLGGMPFQYLVPDEAMLPPGSMRFFTIDPAWMASFLSGADSVGFVPGSFASLPCWKPGTDSGAVVSGLLLRSPVLPGWPQCIVQGFGSTADTVPLAKLRHVLLAHDILLLLFDGLVTTVDVSLPAEAMHFGLELEGERLPANHVKTLQSGIKVMNIVDATTRLVNFSAIRAAMPEAGTHAEFARNMILKAESVRFSVKQD